MNREELLKSREYWITKIQNDLFNLIEDYRKAEGLNRTQLAKRLGFTKGYITQVLNGDFDHKVSKLVDLALSFGKVPSIRYDSLAEIIRADLATQVLTETTSVPSNQGSVAFYAYTDGGDALEPFYKQTA